MRFGTHYGRGTVAAGALLLGLCLVYMVEVAGVLQHARALIAEGWTSAAGPDGSAYYYQLRRVSGSRFFVTQEAWMIAHLWLLWVLIVRALGDPAHRARVVGWLGSAVAVIVAATWVMRAWIAAHGPM